MITSEDSQMPSHSAMLKTTHPLLVLASIFLVLIIGSPKLILSDEARKTKESLTLFDGRLTEAWEFRENAWVVDEDESCSLLLL